MGARPSISRALVVTNSITCAMSAGVSRMSILLTTKTTFLPHSRIRSMKARSLSLKGRSAEVTKSTRSARGTKSSVISWWRRITALVPGVSTMLMSRSHSTGYVTTSMSCSAGRWPASSPYFRRWICAVVGVTPSARTRWPSSALMKADLPELNSPTMTSRNSSSSCSSARSRVARSLGLASRLARGVRSPTSWRRSAWRSSSASLVKKRRSIFDILAWNRPDLTGHGP